MEQEGFDSDDTEVFSIFDEIYCFLTLFVDLLICWYKAAPWVTELQDFILEIQDIKDGSSGGQL